MGQAFTAFFAFIIQLFSAAEKGASANSILTHLKVPEVTKVQLDIGVQENSAIQELMNTMHGLAAQQQKAIQSTLWTHQPYSETRPEENRPRLPVSHWAPHDLRRSSRTLLASMGCPDEIGESILGHMLPGVIGVYNRHSYDEERATWLKRLSDRLESLAEAV